MENPTICLNMIVKDEADIIVNTLSNIILVFLPSNAEIGTTGTLCVCLFMYVCVLLVEFTYIYDFRFI